MSEPTRALVLAKAPVAGRVKTRLGRDIGMDAAAGLAAAALVDTLRACTSAFGPSRCHLALDGDLETAVSGELIADSLLGWSVFAQRGNSFVARLVHAHAFLAAAAHGPVAQIGMDTPQVTPELLIDAAAALDAGTSTTSNDAVLGPASDGGWWILVLRDSANAATLLDVPMSTSTTGADTRRALTTAGLRVASTVTLRDVDTVPDALAVAQSFPGTRFARAWTALEENV